MDKEHIISISIGALVSSVLLILSPFFKEIGERILKTTKNKKTFIISFLIKLFFIFKYFFLSGCIVYLFSNDIVFDKYFVLFMCIYVANFFFFIFIDAQSLINRKIKRYIDKKLNS